MFLNRHMRRRQEALGRRSAAKCNANSRPQGSTQGSSQVSSIVTSSIAAGALMLAAPSAGFAQVVVPSATLGPCVITNTTIVTCTGDLSEGIDVNDPADQIDTLNVYNLNQAIIPAADTNGIYFYRTKGGNLTINADTGTYGITTTGFADGIKAKVAGVGNISITSEGDITAGGHGIFGSVSNLGGVAIDNTGDIDAGINGIYAFAAGYTMITSRGNIAADNHGIYANVLGADIKIDSTGDIAAVTDGIKAYVIGNGNISVTSDASNATDGKIKAGGNGIYTSVSGSGNVTITNTGDIEWGGNNGIFAKTNGGNITITQKGDITATGGSGYGIRARNEDTDAGNITINVTGNISSDKDGVDAKLYNAANGTIDIDVIGHIKSNKDGVDARAKSDIFIDVTEYITAVEDGIEANVSGDGSIMITAGGDIKGVDDDTPVNNGIVATVVGTGNVTITSNGNIRAGKYGIFAQTKGGYITITQKTGNITATTGYGIFADNDDTDAGNININVTGNIDSAGDGVEAQLYNAATGIIDIDVIGNITSNGIGIDANAKNDVLIDVTGDVTAGTVGINAYSEIGDVSVYSDGYIYANVHGIFADAGAGDITIEHIGDIKAVRNGINAKVAGSGNVTITSNGNIHAGVDGIQTYTTSTNISKVSVSNANIQGGDGSGAGINFLSNAGATNILNIYGEVTLSSLGGTAINGGDGDTTINNWGTLNTVSNGDILLGTGANAFNNYAGGVFHSGAVVDLGAGNLFDNHGTVSPGGDGNILTTELTGQFNQTDSGILAVDIDQASGKADRLTVSETAALSGNVRATVMNPAFGPTQNTILSATGGTTDNGLGVIASPALQAALSYPNANDVVLSTDLDFTAPGAELNENQTSLAETVSAALGAGGGALDPVILALLNGPTDNPEYQFALDQLGGESFLNEDTATLFGAEAFGGQMFSCQVNGEQYAAISEGSCLWVRPIQAYTFDRDSTATNIGFNGDAFGTSVGGQTEFAPDWFAGLAFGFENGDLTSDTGVTSDRESFNAGLSLKHTMGAFAVSGVVFAGTSHFDTTRNIAIGGFTATNMASHDVTSIGARARGAYVHEFGGGTFIKPMVDFSLVHLDRGGFSETGTASTALTIAGSSDTYFSATPAVEFGIDHQTKDNQIVRFYGKAGIALYADDGQSLSGSFTNAPAGTAGFVSNTEFDNVFAEVEAGFTFMDDGAATIQLGFQGRYSENSTQSGGFIKANMDF